MKDKGYTQGDMSPTVEDYQRGKDSFSQEGFSQTTQYIERQDKQQKAAASDIKKQAYQGRYN